VNGWFVRGLHAWGGQAMLVVLGMHVLQAVWYGAYRRPREGSFWLLLVLLHLVLGALISGLRLPWDQLSYWALFVELNIAQSVPVVGEPLYTILAGGPTLGQITLTRLYAIHALVLPAIMALVFVGIVALRKKNGWGRPVWTSGGESARWFPGQWARDLGFSLLVLAAVAVVTSMMGGGAPLEAPADPSRDFPARPEWFILPLFALRKLFPPELELLATVVIPGAIVTFLFALPFLDRKEAKGPVGRLAWVAPLLVIGAGLGGLAQMSYAHDAADEDYAEAREIAEARAARAIVLAGGGIPPEGPLAMLANDPMTRGREVYAQYCTSCHVLEGEGERKAPDHTGYGSRAWLRALVEAPQDEHFFGNAELAEDMPSQTRLGDDALRAVVELLYSFGREEQDPDDVDASLLEAGRATMQEKCMNCHIFGDDGDFLGLGGPNLTLYGSRTWIYRQIAHPDADTQYGELNDMPEFHDQLSDHDIRMVTAFLRKQRFEEIDFEVVPGAGEEESEEEE
jgi:ubiquinol-cytochrome c reductase cytochrome b subunit